METEETLEQELREMERRWVEAEQAKDADAMEELLDDDLVLTSFDGQSGGKQEAMQGALAPDFALSSVQLSDLRVRGYGEVGVVTGRADLEMRYQELDLSGEYRYTRVYARRAEQWRIVAVQITRVAN